MGDAALLFTFDSPHRAAAWGATLASAGWPGVIEVVTGLGSVLVEVDPAVTDLDRLAERAAEPGPGHRAPAPAGRTHLVPTTFCGPDLDAVCRLTRLAPEDLVTLMTGATLRVAAVGFAPGFGYLVGLPEPLASVPRRDTPRPTVPSGSVGLAGGFAGVYPRATPGGWHLVGRTRWRPFDPEVPPYARLEIGDAVRFVPAPEPADPSAPEPGGSGVSRRPRTQAPAARFAVEDPGMHTVAQDGGRYGAAHLGVPRAGPADPLAHRLANLLVGNQPQAAALEVTARGPVLRCLATTYVAVVGGGAVVTVDDLEVATGRVVPVTAGQRVAIRRLTSGLRAYVAWPGGVGVPLVMGSRSTDVLAGLGPGALVAGDVLGAYDRAGHLGDRLAAGTPGQGGATPRATRRLRVVAGPHPAWFPADALARLAETRFVVDPASDRVGVRLRPVDGAGIVERRPGELGSQGMVTGAIQVPPDGRPVILGPDHGTLGGYPVVAVVIRADLWVVGQCRPGDEVELEPVSGAEAVAARLALERTVAHAVVGRYPTVPG